MDNPNFMQSIRSPKSFSHTETIFQPFQQYVQSQRHVPLFMPLPEKSPSNYKSLHTHQFPVISNLQDSQPIQPEQHEVQKSIYFSKKKKIILLITFIIMVVILYNEMLVSMLISQYEIKFKNVETQAYPKNLQNVLWIKQYYQIKNALKEEVEMQKQKAKPLKTMRDYMRSVTKQMKKYESKMYDLVGISQLKPLPICIYIPNQPPQKTLPIIQSILLNNYKNIKILTTQKNIQNESSTTISIPQPKSHSKLKQILVQNCQLSSLVLFLSAPIRYNSLEKINQIHQMWNVYVTYSHREPLYEVYSFYLRVYEMYCWGARERGEDCGVEEREELGLGLLELAARRAKKIRWQDMFEKQTDYAYLLVNPTNPTPLTRTPFQALTRLSQDFPISLLQDNKNYKTMLQTPLQTLQQSNLSIQKMQRALQYQDLAYLPKNHYLSERELLILDNTYKIKEWLNKQLQFCIVILSRNNMQNNRYQKVLSSIFMQQYRNYRVVFFDDCSTDGTFNATREFVERRGFAEKFVFVRNLERKYATFNILNAGFNFCKEDQIQVLMDGDDELIGSHVFALLNGLYQKYPAKWLIYTNYKSNLYEFGLSHQQPKQPDKKQSLNSKQRIRGHHMGQLRSFRNKLLRLIPKKYHQNEYGYWLDTVYDDALQHCFFELGPDNALYVPQICYEYNRKYGDNDDSSEQKIINRESTYSYLLSLARLERIQDLKKAEIDSEMKAIMERQLRSGKLEIIY